MSDSDLYRQTVRRAAEILGVEAFTAKLKITPFRLSEYLNGTAAIPMSVFLAAVDIVAAHERAKPPDSP